MGVSSGRSRAADLAFQVFGRPVHPDWFSARGHRRLAQTHWEADVRIIEGGHALHLRSGPTCLTEILCGPETALPEPGLLYHAPVRHERSATLRPSLRLDYMVCFEVERLDPAVFAHLSDELALDATPGDLFFRFAPPNRMAPAPLSRIHLEPRPSGLSVQAFHTFPDERAIVRTQSLFELRGGPAR